MKQFACLFLSVVLLTTACGKKAEKQFDSLASFEGATISFLTGATFDTQINPVIPNVSYKNFNLLSDQVAALRSGKVDAMAVDEPVGRLIAANTPELVMFSETVVADQYGFATSKGSQLSGKATAVLEKLRADGTLEQVGEMWFSADASQKKLPELTHNPDFDGSAGTLRYGCDVTTEPMSYMGSDGQLLGYDIKVISRIAYELNMTLEPISMNFDALLAALDSGKADIVGGGMSMTEERRQQVDFVGPYYEGGVVLLAKKERISSGGADTGKPQLDAAKVGAMTGATGAFYMEKNHPNADLREFDDISDAVTALQSGKVDVAISNLSPTEERKEKVNFTETYFDNPQVLLKRK